MQVLVLNVTGPITSATEELVREAIQRAERTNAEASSQGTGWRACRGG